MRIACPFSSGLLHARHESMRTLIGTIEVTSPVANSATANAQLCVMIGPMTTRAALRLHQEVTAKKIVPTITV